MTEIEMDIDMAKPGGLGGHVDDDIIDFDTDMLDQHDQEPENQDVNTEAMDRDMQEDIDTANQEAYQTNGYVSEDVDFDLHDVEETAHDLEQDVGETTVPQKDGSENQAATSAGSAQEAVDHVEISDEAGNQNQDVQDDHASAHEIDYEVEDDAEQQEPQEELNQQSQNESPKEPHKGVNAYHVEASDADAAAGDAADNAHHSEDVTEAHEQEVQTESADQARGQETTQNDDEKHEQETAPENHEAVALGSAEDAAADNIEEADYEDGDQYNDEHSADRGEVTTHEAEADHDNAEHAEDVEHTTYDEAEVDVDEHPKGETVDIDHDDHSATGDDSAAKPETEFPAITVQYKGDEFPLFSATSDGFFTDTSILDETLEKLLAGLRSELENEIAEEDELVFQVDELGLELAESTQGELMTNVTFRQIVEIFDLLVKNQDPDGSKTLYTYLFTKPNTERRLESLIESATAGKGLDEVIHLFESPMPAASTLMEADNAVDGLHEELDAFDSPEDEGQPDEGEIAEHDEENSREAGLDTDVEVPTAHGDAEVEHDDDDVTTEPTTEPPANAGTHDETVTETSHHPDAVAEDKNSEKNALVDNEADPFADLELDVGAEDDDEVDLGDDAATEEQVAVELETAHAGTNDTSTTATLKDDEDETGSINVDLSADATEEGTVEKTGLNEENDLDEIDWRDEPEVDDEGPSTPSAAGKRARGDDDEVDAEDEQDVKRRRP